MQIKRNEHMLGTTMRYYGYYVHKWGDVRYAHCPKCNAAFPLPKAEKKPDFLVAKEYAFVEAKGAGNSWNYADDFRPNQIEFMTANPRNSWVFVEMGEGKAPEGKLAFLMLWTMWKNVSDALLKTGFKSILFEKTDKSRAPAIRDWIPENYFLQWKDGKWEIHNNHPWWREGQ